MATKPIFTVDVNDAAFKRFIELFEKYRAALDKMPGQWGDIGSAAMAAMLAQSRAQKEASEAAAKLKRENEGISRLWLDIERHTGRVAKNIADTTVSLLKWGTLAQIFGGLMGAGGLWGLDKIGQGLVATRRTAYGSGMSVGELEALRVNYSPYVDVDSTAANIAGAKRDPTKGWIFGGIGINDQNGVSSSDLFMEVINKAASFGKDHLGANNEIGWKVSGLSQFLDSDTIAALQKGGLGNAESGARGDIARFGTGSRTDAAWLNFTVSLERTGKELETTFRNSLVSLAGPIGKLSDSAGRAIEAFGHSEQVKIWLDKLSDGLEWLSNWLDGKKQQDQGGSRPSPGSLGYGMGPTSAIDKTPYNPYKALSDQLAIPNYDTNSVGGDKSTLAYKAWKFLSGIGQVESSGNPKAVSPKGAMGLMQIMPETWAQYGKGDPFNPEDSKKAAQAYIQHLSQVFGKDVEKVAAAYNWGEGNLLNDIKRNGAAWKSRLPAETRDYVIKVTNATGGNAVINANQAAPQ